MGNLQYIILKLISCFCPCEFSIIVLTNYHKFKGFKGHVFIILQFCRSEILCGSQWTTIKVEAGLCSFLWTLGWIHFLPSSNFLRLPTFLGSWPLSSILQVCKECKLFLHASFWPRSPFPLRTLVIPLGPPIQDNLPRLSGAT